MKNESNRASGARVSARLGTALAPGAARSSTGTLSGRQRTELARHLRHLAGLSQTVRTNDRLLTGSLAACSVSSQTEMLAEMLEAVQELRVELQRMEACIVGRPTRGINPA